MLEAVGLGMNRVIATIPKNAGERVQVELTEYRDHDLVDIRVYANDGADWVPTRKGVTARVALLPGLVAALKQAEQEARAAGLIPSDQEE